MPARLLLWILLALLVGPVCVDGQTTVATFTIPMAANSVTTGSLALIGLPSYSQLTLTETPSAQILVINECIPGEHSYDDSLTCTLCLSGKYSPYYTAPSPNTCVNCVSGTYSTNLGANSVTTCLDCGNGTYFAGTGGNSQDVCAACPAYSSSYQGAKLLQACICNPGYSGANGGACTACNTSVWCLNGQANPCPSHSKSSPMASSLAQCLCSAGYYGDASMGGPDLTICQVRSRVITNLSYPPLSLYPPTQPVRARKCPGKKCPGILARALSRALCLGTCQGWLDFKTGVV